MCIFFNSYILYSAMETSRSSSCDTLLSFSPCAMRSCSWRSAKRCLMPIPPPLSLSSSTWLSSSKILWLANLKRFNANNVYVESHQLSEYLLQWLIHYTNILNVNLTTTNLKELPFSYIYCNEHLFSLHEANNSWICTQHNVQDNLLLSTAQF